MSDSASALLEVERRLLPGKDDEPAGAAVDAIRTALLHIDAWRNGYSRSGAIPFTRDEAAMLLTALAMQREALTMMHGGAPIEVSLYLVEMRRTNDALFRRISETVR